MDLPSGAQTGSSSSADVKVNRDSVERMRSRIQRSWFPVCKSMRRKATRVSSGERAKSNIEPGGQIVWRRFPERSYHTNCLLLIPAPDPNTRVPFIEAEKKPK